MANPARELSMELLLKGVAVEEVAASVGVDVSYVMGLLNDEVFSKTLNQKRASRVADSYDKDSAIDSLEVVALSRLTDLLPYESDINKVLKAFSALNKADRRSQGERGPKATGTVVELHLPAHIMRHTTVPIQIDQQGQVVAVDGRVLQTLDTQSVLAQAGERSSTLSKLLSDKQLIDNITVDDL